MGLKKIFKKGSTFPGKQQLSSQSRSQSEALSLRPYRPKDMPALSPYLMSPDPENLANFLTRCFAFEFLTDPLKKEGEVTHIELYSPDARIMIGKEGAWPFKGTSPRTSGEVTQGISLYLYVPDVDQHYERAKEQEAEILSAPQETFWGDRVYVARDIDGYIWVFATYINDYDPSMVPQFH